MNSIKPTEAIWPDEITHAVLAQLSYDDKCDWLKWAWARMSEAGLVPAHLVTDDPNYVEHVLTLAGLGYLLRQFQEVYTGCNCDYEPTMELWGAERPFLQPDDLIDVDDEDDEYDLDYAMHDILAATIADRARQLRLQLGQLLGPTTFFTTLGLTVSLHRDEAETLGPDDPSDNACHWVMNTNLTADKLCAYAWLTNA